mgnify:CR=1 FL=1
MSIPFAMPEPVIRGTAYIIRKADKDAAAKEPEEKQATPKTQK